MMLSFSAKQGLSRALSWKYAEASVLVLSAVTCGWTAGGLLEVRGMHVVGQEAG